MTFLCASISSGVRRSLGITAIVQLVWPIIAELKGSSCLSVPIDGERRCFLQPVPPHIGAPESPTALRNSSKFYINGKKKRKVLLKH